MNQYQFDVFVFSESPVATHSFQSLFAQNFALSKPHHGNNTIAYASPLNRIIIRLTY